MHDYPKHICELKTAEELDALKYDKNWQKKLKRRFQSLFLISSKNFRSFLFLRTRGAIQREIMKQKNSKYWYVVHPFSLLRLYWEIFMLFTYFALILLLSFRASFLNSYMAAYYTYAGMPLTNIFVANCVDFSLSIICVIDMLGFFITGYYDDERRETVMTPREIRRKYFFPNFIFDLSSSFPADSLIVLFAGMTSYARISRTGFICLELYNLYRLVRFRRFIYYLTQNVKLDIFSELSFRVMVAILVYICLIHWMITFSVVVPQIILGEDLYKSEKNESWIRNSNFLEMSLREQYVTTLIKALQNNVGANESGEGLFNAGDYFLGVLSSFLGRIYFIFFLITFLEAITAASALKVKLRIILDQLKVYMKNKDLPVSLKKRLSRFYLYRFQAHYFSNRAMLERLTESLRKEISTYTCQRLLHNTEVFQSVPKKILTGFVQRMNREMYFPKDVIIQGNTFGECMYFICSGSVAVETLSEKEICTLGDGDFFGEIALIVPDRRRVATVKALTITELYRLEYSDYKYIIELYPDVYDKLEKYALERYKTTIILEGRHDYRRTKIIENRRRLEK